MRGLTLTSGLVYLRGSRRVPDARMEVNTRSFHTDLARPHTVLK